MYLARLTAALVLALGCASAPPKPAASDAAAPSVAAAETTTVAPNAAPAPLATLSGQRIALLPVHYFRALDTLGLSSGLTRPNDYLAQLDAEIRFALEDRGVAKQWVMPADLVRAAKRNPMHTADPTSLAAEALRAGVRRRDAQLPDPLGTQLRSIAAIAQTRFLLFPVELRLENATTGGGGRAILRVALLDSRMNQVRWAGEVSTELASTPDTQVAASLASRLADLISPSSR